MYWAPDLQSINEYLCTVRCSIAAKDEKSLHATVIEEPVSTHIEGSDGNLAEENLRNGSNFSSNEDGWVEVKAPDSSPLDDGSTSLQSRINTNAARISQVCGSLLDNIHLTKAFSCPVFLIFVIGVSSMVAFHILTSLVLYSTTREE